MEVYIITMVPVGIAMVAFALRIEKRLTKIETTVCWLKKEFKSCRHNSAENTK